MANLVQWISERPRVKHYLQERALERVAPLNVSAADPTHQALIDEYNTVLADVQASKGEASLTPTGAWVLTRGRVQTTLQPDGRILSTDKRERYWGGPENTLCLEPMADGSIRYQKVVTTDSKAEGYLHSSVSGTLKLVDGKLIDADAFKPDAGMLDLPTAADDTARTLLEEYRKALTEAADSPIGRYETRPVIKDGGFGREYSHNTTSTPNSKTLTFDDRSPFHSQGTITLSHDGSLRIDRTSWCGWGTVNENRDHMTFTRRPDGSIECTRSGGSSKSWLAGRDFLTRPAPVVSGGFKEIPTVRILISADGHATPME